MEPGQDGMTPSTQATVSRSSSGSTTTTTLAPLAVGSMLQLYALASLLSMSPVLLRRCVIERLHRETRQTCRCRTVDSATEEERGSGEDARVSAVAIETLAMAVAYPFMSYPFGFLSNTNAASGDDTDEVHAEHTAIGSERGRKGEQVYTPALPELSLRIHIPQKMAPSSSQQVAQREMAPFPDSFPNSSTAAQSGQQQQQQQREDDQEKKEKKRNDGRAREHAASLSTETQEIDCKKLSSGSSSSSSNDASSGGRRTLLQSIDHHSCYDMVNTDQLLAELAEPQFRRLYHYLHGSTAAVASAATMTASTSTASDNASLLKGRGTPQMRYAGLHIYQGGSGGGSVVEPLPVGSTAAAVAATQRTGRAEHQQQQQQESVGTDMTRRRYISAAGVPLYAPPDVLRRHHLAFKHLLPPALQSTDGIARLCATSPAFVLVLLEVLLEQCAGDTVKAEAEASAKGKEAGGGGSRWQEKREARGAKQQAARKAFEFILERYAPVLAMQRGRMRCVSERLRSILEGWLCTPPRSTSCCNVNDVPPTWRQELKAGEVWRPVLVQLSTLRACAVAHLTATQQQQQQQEDAAWALNLASILIMTRVFPFLDFPLDGMMGLVPPGSSCSETSKGVAGVAVGRAAVPEVTLPVLLCVLDDLVRAPSSATDAADLQDSSSSTIISIAAAARELLGCFFLPSSWATRTAAHTIDRRGGREQQTVEVRSGESIGEGKYRDGLTHTLRILRGEYREVNNAMERRAQTLAVTPEMWSPMVAFAFCFVTATQVGPLALEEHICLEALAENAQKRQQAVGGLCHHGDGRALDAMVSASRMVLLLGHTASVEALAASSEGGASLRSEVFPLAGGALVGGAFMEEAEQSTPPNGEDRADGIAEGERDGHYPALEALAQTPVGHRDAPHLLLSVVSPSSSQPASPEQGPPPLPSCHRPGSNESRTTGARGRGTPRPRHRWRLPERVPAQVTPSHMTVMACLTMSQPPLSLAEMRHVATAATAALSPSSSSLRVMANATPEKARGSSGSSGSSPSQQLQQQQQLLRAQLCRESVAAMAQWWLQALLMHMADVAPQSGSGDPATSPFSTIAGGVLKGLVIAPHAPAVLQSKRNNTTSPLAAATSSTPAFSSAQAAAASAGPTFVDSTTSALAAIAADPPPSGCFPLAKLTAACVCLAHLLQQSRSFLARTSVGGTTLALAHTVTAQLTAEARGLAKLHGRRMPGALMMMTSGVVADGGQVEAEASGCSGEGRLTDVVMRAATQLTLYGVQRLTSILQRRTMYYRGYGSWASQNPSWAAADDDRGTSPYGEDEDVCLAELEALQCAIHLTLEACASHQRRRPLSAEAQVGLGTVVTALVRLALLLEAAAGSAGEPVNGEAPTVMMVRSTRVRRLLAQCLGWAAAAVDIALHEYSAGYPHFLCESLAVLSSRTPANVLPSSSGGGDGNGGCGIVNTGKDEVIAAATAATSPSMPLSMWDALRQTHYWRLNRVVLEVLEAAAATTVMPSRMQRQQQQQQPSSRSVSVSPRALIEQMEAEHSEDNNDDDDDEEEVPCLDEGETSMRAAINVQDSVTSRASLSPAPSAFLATAQRATQRRAQLINGSSSARTLVGVIPASAAPPRLSSWPSPGTDTGLPDSQKHEWCLQTIRYWTREWWAARAHLCVTVPSSVSVATGGGTREEEGKKGEGKYDDDGGSVGGNAAGGGERDSSFIGNSPYYRWRHGLVGECGVWYS